MSDDREPITIMRRGMTAEADRAPDAAALTERILATAAATTTPPATAPVTRRLRGWALPGLAAATVVAVTAAVLVGTRVLLPDDQSSATAPTTAVSPSPIGSTGPSGGVVPAGFRPVDVSFVNRDDGWALGSVPCPSGRCTELVRTRDGGSTWVSVPAPPLALPASVEVDPVLAGCNAVVCISQIRLATPQIGYVFNGWQLFMTVDGGSTWRLQPGGGGRLAIANGTAWWIGDSSTKPCEASCHIRLQAARVGSSAWRDVPLPSVATSGSGADVARNGDVAALEIYGTDRGGPSGTQGSSPSRSMLLTSTDAGSTWTVRREPCLQARVGAESLAPTVAPDGSITLMCRPRNGGGEFTVTSTDGGATFVPSAPLSGTSGYVIGAASSSVVFAVTDILYRSADAGRSWHSVLLGDHPGTGVFEVEFRTANAGYVLAQNERGVSPTIWSTTDAGASWTNYSFR